MVPGGHIQTATGGLVTVASHPLVSSVITDEASMFLLDLHQRFEPTRRALLDDRVIRQRSIDAGHLPAFKPETAHIRNGEWSIAPAPPDLRDRRTEITGPVERAFMVEALNSGAKVFMADFEDACSPTWSNILEGQLNIRDAYSGRLDGVGDNAATLVVRTRAWHLDEKHITVDGMAMSAALVDFGLCLFHNAQVAIDHGSGPYFYLPKVEGQADARLWNEVFDHSEEQLGLPPGTIRATVFVETILAAFEMDEILFELRDHITGLHTGNWDYLFSVAKTFRNDPAFLLPDRDQISVKTPFMRAFTELLVATCHRRRAHAIGGMSGVVPDHADPERTAPALRKVTVDKRREAGDGFDGTRLAHPDIVSLASAEFDKVLGSRSNQVERQRDDVYVTADDLLAIASTRGTITESGVRTNIRIVICYLSEWLCGNGTVAIDDHLEDTAMAEVCRAQLWQWRHHRAVLADGRTVDDTFLRRLIDEETAAHRDEFASDGVSRHFGEARELLDALLFTDDFPDFLTIPAYELLCPNVPAGTFAPGFG